MSKTAPGAVRSSIPSMSLRFVSSWNSGSVDVTGNSGGRAALRFFSFFEVSDATPETLCDDIRVDVVDIPGRLGTGGGAVWIDARESALILPPLFFRLMRLNRLLPGDFKGVETCGGMYRVSPEETDSEMLGV